MRDLIVARSSRTEHWLELERMQPELALQGDYQTLVRLLREFTAASVAAPSQSESDKHHLRLWYRLLGLGDTLALLTKSCDAPGAQIILRSQLEIFARLQHFRAKPDEAWLSERANALDQLQRVQSHHDAFPDLRYSMNVQRDIDTRCKQWPDLTFKQKANGSKKVNGTLTIHKIFKSVGEANLTDMSAYGFYQFLCEETHSGMLRVAARHTIAGQPSAANAALADERAAALITSAWMFDVLAEPYLAGLTNDMNVDRIADIRRISAAFIAAQTVTVPATATQI
jgi:hypothetical protein